MTPEERTLHGVARAAKLARSWTTERDERIREAVAAGIPQREVARAAGLSHTAVARIVARGI